MQKVKIKTSKKENSKYSPDIHFLTIFKSGLLFFHIISAGCGGRTAPCGVR
jgi:hypothetical protein